MMKHKFIGLVAMAIATLNTCSAFAAGTTIDFNSSPDSSDSPWNRRMSDVTGLFGESIKGSAVNDASKGGSFSFDTFTPFQDQRTGVVNGYGATEVGVGCNGLNLGTILDGQIGQYQEMVEQFIQNAPALAIMFLAYSQPTIKSVIDQLNTVGQFGLDLSNMTCSGVRALADKAYDEKKQTLAEADCTVDEGYKSSKCMAGEGLTGSLLSQMSDFKQQTSDRANSLMGKVSSSTGGLIGFHSSVGGGGKDSGAGTGSGNGSSGSSPSVASKSCSDSAPDGSAGVVLAASELGCDDIKKYAGLIPSYGVQGDAASVTPRTLTLESLSKSLTTEYMDLYKSVYTADSKGFKDTKAYKELVSRGDIVITENEHQYMRNLARSNPPLFVSTERQLATLGMMKELDDVISKIEIGVSSGIANQPDKVILSDEVIGRTKFSVFGLRQQYQALEARIKHDQERNKVFTSAQQVTQ